MASQFVKGTSAQEHLLYITEKVNPILEALVTAVLLEKPEDPTRFMLKWLVDQTKTLESGESGQSSAEEMEAVRAEIAKLTARRAQLLAAKASDGKAKDLDDHGETDGDTTKAGDPESEEEEDDDEDAPDMPDPRLLLNRGPRQSVSAEAYGNWNVKGNFNPPVYDKSEDQIQRIRVCLQSSFLFSSLDDEDIKTVILALKDYKLEPNTTIIKQGDDANCMYVIEEGDIECLKLIDGTDKVVKTCGPGDAFGELALLYNCPRAASVRSRDKPCQLWELDRESFNHIVKDAAAKKRTNYTEFLKNVPLFRNMDEYEMMSLADALKTEIFDGVSTQILKQGDIGDKFYVVLEGEVTAKKSFAAGTDERQVMVHKAGDYFGELAVINDEPRVASIYTATDKVKCLTMEKKIFKRLLGPIEDILRREAQRYDSSSQ